MTDAERAARLDEVRDSFLSAIPPAARLALGELVVLTEDVCRDLQARDPATLRMAASRLVLESIGLSDSVLETLRAGLSGETTASSFRRN